MPMPGCSPCCSGSCSVCLHGNAPLVLEAVLAGVVNKVPTPFSPCDNCVGTNDTYLLDFQGEFGGSYCEWLYTVDPFGEPPLPCFSDMVIRIQKGGGIWTDTYDPDHYYLSVLIGIGFDNAGIAFLADLGTDPPDCMALDGVVCAWQGQSDAGSGSEGQWYCDYTGATITVSVLP